MYLCILGALFLAARDVYHIFRLSRRLRRGYPPDHRKNWHATARVYRISRGITLGAFSLVMVLAFGTLVQMESRQPLETTRVSSPLPRCRT